MLLKSKLGDYCETDKYPDFFQGITSLIFSIQKIGKCIKQTFCAGF